MEARTDAPCYMLDSYPPPILRTYRSSEGLPVAWQQFMGRYRRFSVMIEENQYKIQYRGDASTLQRRDDLSRNAMGQGCAKEAMYVKIDGMTISDLVSLPVSKLYDWINALPPKPK